MRILVHVCFARGVGYWGVFEGWGGGGGMEMGFGGGFFFFGKRGLFMGGLRVLSRMEEIKIGIFLITLSMLQNLPVYTTVQVPLSSGRMLGTLSRPLASMRRLIPRRPT